MDVPNFRENGRFFEAFIFDLSVFFRPFGPVVPPKNAEIPIISALAHLFDLQLFMLTVRAICTFQQQLQQ